jgi:hypothetical protein
MLLDNSNFSKVQNFGKVNRGKIFINCENKLLRNLENTIKYIAMKKIFFILLLMPLLNFAQSNKEVKEYERKRKLIADTSNFSNPLLFTFIDTPNLSNSQLYNRIYQGLASVVRNLNFSMKSLDSSRGKMIISDLKSSLTSNEYYNITIDTKDKKYRIIIDNYTTDFSISGIHEIRVPLEKAELEDDTFKGQKKIDYWKGQKLTLKEEAFAIFDLIKKAVQKEDNF